MKAIRNIYETFNGRNLVIVVSADEDDQTMTRGSIKRFCNQFSELHLIFGKSSSKIEAINRDLDKAGEWDILVNMSDDMHFIVRDWNLQIEGRVRNTWGESLDFFAHFNDGYVGAGLPTMSIMGRDYFKRDGYIYHPSYKSFSCDAEAMYVAQLRQRWAYFPEVLFKHQHPANSPLYHDSLYRRNSLYSEHDTRNYWQRMKNDFQENLSPGTIRPYHMHMETAKRLGS